MLLLSSTNEGYFIDLLKVTKGQNIPSFQIKNYQIKSEIVLKIKVT